MKTKKNESFKSFFFVFIQGVGDSLQSQTVLKPCLYLKKYRV